MMLKQSKSLYNILYKKNNRENSRSDLILIISKLIATIIFSFYQDAQYDWFLIVVIILLSSMQFFKHFLDKPNYNKSLQLYLSVLNGIYFWTCFVILIAYVFADYKFKGTVFLWIFGLPIIVVLLVLLSDDSSYVLSCNINQFQKGEDVQKYIRYFLKSVDNKNKDRNSDMLLKGYIYNHEETCDITDCPLSDYINIQRNRNDLSIDNYNNLKKRHSLDDLLYLYAQRLFQLGLSKFPNCTGLRIKHALFQWERFSNKNLALQSLSIAEKYNPPMDQKFIIYRYRKIISEEEESKTYTGEALDLVSGIAYESHYKQCFLNIEKTTQLYLDFWEVLLNTNTTPDINKLNEIGLKINNTYNSIEVHWKSMQSLKPNDPKTLKLYSGYLLNVLNEKAKGNELAQLWKESVDKKQSNTNFLNINLDESTINAVKEGSGIIICHDYKDNEDKKEGLIYKVSSSCCKIFGYLESEMVGKSIDFLFLDIYKDHINSYIQSILNKKERSTNSKKDNNNKPNEYYSKDDPMDKFTPYNINNKSSKKLNKFTNERDLIDDNNDVSSPQVKKNKITYNNYESKFIGDFFFGKTKYQKSIPIQFKLIDIKSLSRDKKIFVCLITVDNSLSYIKYFVKNCYFIINSNLKIVSNIFTSNTYDVLSILNRKITDKLDSIDLLFPEIHVNNQPDNEEFNNDSYDFNNYNGNRGYVK